MNTRDEQRSAVVGYDGSPASVKALCWAVREAESRELPLEVCHAWQWPFRDHDEQASRIVRAMGRSSPTRGWIARGRWHRNWRSALARGAALLVVGDRGDGSAPPALLGAVTRTVLHEAPCPIAIVHEEPSPATAS